MFGKKLPTAHLQEMYQLLMYQIQVSTQLGLRKLLATATTTGVK